MKFSIASYAGSEPHALCWYYFNSTWIAQHWLKWREILDSNNKALSEREHLAD